MKMENEKISVIVPVYNAEKYLRDCVDSILSQSYQNIEVLLIDDGSQDASGKICDDYQMQDSRVKAVHKNNGGVSSARNEGLELCSGEYIAFIDADDYVDKEYLRCLYQNIKNKCVDISVCNHRLVLYNKTKHSENFGRSRYIKLDENMSFMKNTFLYSVWGMLIKKDCLTDIKFDTAITMGEDALFVAEVIKRSQALYYEHKSLYMYRQNSESVTHQKNIEKLETLLHAWEKIISFQRPESIAYKSAKMAYLIECRRVATVMWLNDIWQFDRSEELRQMVKMQSEVIWKVKYSLKQKIILMMFAYVPSIYYSVYKEKKMMKLTEDVF